MFKLIIQRLNVMCDATEGFTNCLMSENLDLRDQFCSRINLESKQKEEIVSIKSSVTISLLL